MKRKIIAAIVVLFLFGIVAMAISQSKNNASPSEKNASVKICPHTGLPCEGDGDCDEGSDCDSHVDGDCDSHSDAQ